MPSQKIINRLNRADPETKLDILDERADSVYEEEEKKIKKTAEKQYIPLDKMYMALLIAAKNGYQEDDIALSDAEKYDLGIRGRKNARKENLQYERVNRLFREAVDSLIKMPPTLQDYENFHTTLSLITAKAAHDLAKAREEIRKELPGDLDEQTKDDLADYLVCTVNVLPHRILQCTLDLQNELKARPLTLNGEEIDCSVHMGQLLTADIEARMQTPEGRAMTVREYWTLAKMSEEEQASLLKTMHCSAEDRILDVFYQKVKRSAEKKGTVYKSEEEKRNKLQHRAIETLSLSYAAVTVEHWKRNGAEKYEKGLQGPDRNAYRKGVKLHNLAGMERGKFEAEVKAKVPNLKAFDDRFSHKYFWKAARQINAFVLSEKPLMLREQPGLSESYSAGNAKYTERMFATKGALLALEGTGSTWKHHSGNSDAYEKMVSSIKNYHQALAANEGGKALSRRNEMYLAITNYIEDKYAKRKSPEGQTRFNAALTLLYQELKPEGFRALLARVNAKRGAADQIRPEALELQKESFILSAKNSEKEAQEATKDFATLFPNRYGYELAELDTSLIPGPGEAYPAIGLRGNEMLTHLSDRDYSAIAYTCALSSPKQNDLLINNDLLHPSAEQIDDGRRAANEALAAYGEGNKQPLGAMLSIALRKTGREIQNRPVGTEKVVMTEINARIKNMLERDPELKKYALRSGLKASELEPAPAADAGSKNKNTITEKNHENQIIIK